MTDPELSAIRDDLSAILERLDDVALESLRLAVEAGETSRPERERRVTRARHAIERAIGLLRED